MAPRVRHEEPQSPGRRHPGAFGLSPRSRRAPAPVAQVGQHREGQKSPWTSGAGTIYTRQVDRRRTTAATGSRNTRGGERTRRTLFPCPTRILLMRCKVQIPLLAFVLLSLSPVASAAPPVRVADFSLPGAARPITVAYDAPSGQLLIGARPRSGFPDLYALAFGPDQKTPALSWSLDLDEKIYALAVDGNRAYLATSGNKEEMLVLDLALGTRIGSFDAAGSADAYTVEVVEPGLVSLGRRRSSGPEFYRLDVNDPMQVIVREASEDALGAQPPRNPTRGQLVAAIALTTDRGMVAYRVMAGGEPEVQVFEATVPVIFGDINGDGVYRLGCVGDSNTAAPLPAFPSWCEMLENQIADPDFQIVNVAVSGATVVIPNLHSTSDAVLQMEEVLGFEPDAVALAFGTNDILQERTPDQILDAYLAQADMAASRGVTVFVATTPPLGPLSYFLIIPLNAALREMFPSQVLEFSDGFTNEYFKPDGIHLSQAGQALRADRALDVLANPALHDPSYGTPP